MSFAFLALSLTHAATLTVGPNSTYGTIGDAENAASAGDIIEIEAGEYVEDLVLRKRLHLRGAGQGQTIIKRRTQKTAIEAKAGLILESLTVDAEGKQAIQGARRLSLLDVEVTDSNTLGFATLLASIDASDEMVIEDSWIHDNVSKVSAVDAHHGLTAVNSVFERNTSQGDGGAIKGAYFGPMHVTDCTFIDNYAANDGGAIYLFVSNDDYTNQLLHNRFLGNASGAQGGAVWLGGDVSFPYLDLQAKVRDNVFIDNVADLGGGALTIEGVDYGYYVVGLPDFHVRLNRNTFTANEAPVGAHVNVGRQVDLRSTNGIFTHGRTGDAVNLEEPAREFDHALFWDNDGVGSGAGFVLGPNSLEADPLFTDFSDDGDPLNDDLRLQPGSPAIDAGWPGLGLDPDGSVSDLGARI